MANAPQIPHLSFTIESNGILREIITKVGVIEPFQIDPSSTSPLNITWFDGVWDTGATNTNISPRVVEALNLKPISFIDAHHAGGKSRAPVYLVHLYLPNNVLIPSVEVMGFHGTPGCDMLIGMDVITKGDFAITNHNNKTTVSFVMPSQGTIDFNKKLKASVANQMPPPVKNAKQHPNDKCACGSGLKYKKCHGK